jgi:protein Tex
MEYEHIIANTLTLQPRQVSAAIDLLDGENTVPFIARYRKEATGGLDEEQLRLIGEQINRLRSLDERRKAVLKSIEEQGKLTPAIRQQILSAPNLTTLEDLYQPYKPKRSTRASVARQKGLQPLADMILKQERTVQPLEKLSAPFVKEDVPTSEEAWSGACDIVAETISDHPEVRRKTREKALQWGEVTCEKTGDAQDDRKVYELYYEFDFRVDKIRQHQVLAINRGEQEKILRVKVIVPERDWQRAMLDVFRPDQRSPLASLLQKTMSDAAGRLLLPAIERDVRRLLTEKAETHAIRVFSENLRALLSQPPLAGRTVMGIDPGFRTGCKVAVVDPTGKVLSTETIYPHEPQKRWEEAIRSLTLLVVKHEVSLISIGNGTASRETEMLAAELIKRLEVARKDAPGKVAPASTKVNKSVTTFSIPEEIRYMIVNEAGASVYSASPLARAEFPELDVSLRGAVSIARRLQDPLAELVKIDPKSIGVGLYQHDVDQKLLEAALTGVVESVVNSVGVDLNTASPALLTYVSGIGPKLAEKIVAYRNENGPFPSRNALREVKGMGEKAFEQSAGFLRVRGGEDPLDASAIHPESYDIARELLSLAGLDPQTLPAQRKPALDDLLCEKPVEKLAAELRTGVPTLADILDQLVRPGRDPRADAPAPILRSDVLRMEDLVVGMTMKGTVRNVVDFGVFVDIGVKQDGLLHRSQTPPGTLLKVGDVIDIVILKVEPERERIALGWPEGRVHSQPFDRNSTY